MIRKYITILLLPLTLAGILNGCNTLKGVGQDVEARPARFIINQHTVTP